ncbi:MAG TPA: response regulator transcription factor [Steroidobacteraceae bacterium]|nr:response regulator transcription factor [Steroidobacteraceae bacterium]
MKLLLVEDSARLAAALLTGFRGEGFAVDHAGDGRTALAYLGTHEYDLLILDLMLPRLPGLEVLRTLRAAQAPTRVLILSARDQIEDRVEALNLGADDYLLKPFDFAELKARVLALLRRRYGEISGKLSCGDLVLDTSARVASARGAPLPLTPKEYALLETLLRHRGRSFTRAALFERLYDGLSDASDRVIEVVVSTLRTKLDKAGLPALIQTRRGFGYRVP